MVIVTGSTQLSSDQNFPGPPAEFTTHCHISMLTVTVPSITGNKMVFYILPYIHVFNIKPSKVIVYWAVNPY